MIAVVILLSCGGSSSEKKTLLIFTVKNVQWSFSWCLLFENTEKTLKEISSSDLENLADGFIKSPKLCKREKTKTQSQNDSQRLYKLENRKEMTCRQWWRIGSQHLENPVNNVMVLEANLTRRQPREKLQCLYENLMSNNFCKTAFLKKKNELWTNASLLRILLKQNKLKALHVVEALKSLLKFFTHLSVKISREKLQTNVEIWSKPLEKPKHRYRPQNLLKESFAVWL